MSSSAKDKGNAEVRALAQRYTDEAIRKLVSLIWSTETSELTQFYAAQELLNRGHGRPATAVVNHVARRPLDRRSWPDARESGRRAMHHDKTIGAPTIVTGDPCSRSRKVADHLIATNDVPA